ncbi:MAG TPA: type II toxin-antitoxin system HicB family antitoxin [Dehalococcoidia bacterium]|nr:type II toxin-antitoxin system HicB family antitoxin [Dehalococcoidia bacterium]
MSPWDEGGYIAEVPAIQGCWVVGETTEQVIDDIQEAIRLCLQTDHLEDRFLPEELPLRLTLPITMP